MTNDCRVSPVSHRIFHITHIQNLSGILSVGGLRSNRLLQQASVPYSNIAHQTIQDRRATAPVPCGSGGTLHDYVPFYFAPRSPMLYTINQGNVPGCTSQQAVVHLVSTAEVVHASGAACVFTDGHAVMAYSSFFTDLADLAQVDWTVMRATYWNNTPDDPDRRRRRQAEFLVRDFFPWSLCLGVGVADEQTKGRVEEILRAAGQQTKVAVKADWYY